MLEKSIDITKRGSIVSNYVFEIHKEVHYGKGR
jgi:hypothetical protein